MAESVARSANEYTDLIREVLIDPIRTVTVIDDEFPTLDQLLDKEAGVGSKKWTPENVTRATEIVQFCREPDRRWMVDIHDGGRTDTEELFIGHLHQSDLLVLDYQLQGEQGGGERAIEILRKLAKNSHFNMVLVYTHAASDDASTLDIAHDIALNLTFKGEGIRLPERARERLEQALEEWADEEPSIENSLRDAVDASTYLRVRSDQVPNSAWGELPGFAQLKAWHDNKPSRIRLDFRLLMRWAISELEQSISDRLSDEDFGHTRLGVDSGGTNWVRTDNLFISVIGKHKTPDTLPDSLLNALTAWDPSPHRLIMSKMRAELDRRGVSVEQEIMADRCLQAGWLEEFISPDRYSPSRNIGSTVQRHWESLGDRLRPDVVEFAGKLQRNLSGGDIDASIRRFARVERKPHVDEIHLELNRYNSSKPVEGHHLSTGHVLRLVENQESIYWLCLSPACDLEPDQRSGWNKSMGDLLPFKAVPLEKLEKTAKALKEAHKNAHLFFYIDGKTHVFSCDLGRWEELFAAKRGVFDPIEDRQLEIVRLTARDALEANTHQATIVAQLRYEYALHWLSLLGAKLARVGLDFKSSPPGNG